MLREQPLLYPFRECDLKPCHPLFKRSSMATGCNSLVTPLASMVASPTVGEHSASQIDKKSFQTFLCGSSLIYACLATLYMTNCPWSKIITVVKPMAV